jgi:hypothetical protein
LVSEKKGNEKHLETKNAQTPENAYRDKKIERHQNPRNPRKRNQERD